MQALRYDFTVKDTAFDPSQPNPAPVVLVYQPGAKEKELYKVWILLEGDSLPFVDYVEYTLHETFPNPQRKVQRTISNPRCMLAFWTWGLFTIKVVIYLKTGDTVTMDHYTTYNQDFARAKFKRVSSTN